jgi:hypothetical protein
MKTMKDIKNIKEKAEELYTYYDDLLSRELQLNTLVKASEITEFVKDCARKVCSEMITELEKSSEGGRKIRMKFWYAVRKEIECSELYKD